MSAAQTNMERRRQSLTAENMTANMKPPLPKKLNSYGAGDVVKVEPQKTFALYGKNGGRICTHRVDFLLTFQDGHQEVREAKGFWTPTFTIKLKLFEDNYPEIPYEVITPRERFYGSKKRPTLNWYTRSVRQRSA